MESPWVRQTCPYKHVWTCSRLPCHFPVLKHVLTSKFTLKQEMDTPSDADFSAKRARAKNNINLYWRKKIISMSNILASSRPNISNSCSTNCSSNCSLE